MPCPVIFLDPGENSIFVMQVQTNQQTKQVDMGDIVEEVEAENHLPICSKINNGIGHTKVVILVIGGSMVLGGNLETISNEFRRCNIVLIVVVADSRPRYDISKFYYELTRNTSGEYMLLQDVSKVDAGLQIDSGNTSTNTSINGDQNEITDGVEAIVFDHGLS
ncbi:unnamed protein product [Adineta steineri]|uniref:Uncharacterized protein n=1 Tax=Adineta steineri TaxID=433720 RepID=A0A819JKW8_9BILA|nr:unnamed protein product [Adineta steineri]CAF3934585.1 unnamed protein product [Adineta steineri]